VRIILGSLLIGLIGCSVIAPSAIPESGANAANAHAISVRSYRLQYSKQWPKHIHWLWVSSDVACELTSMPGGRVKGCEIDATIPSGNYGVVSIQLYSRRDHHGCRVAGGSESNAIVTNGKPYSIRLFRDTC
jgi:hypothetical protein